VSEICVHFLHFLAVPVEGTFIFKGTNSKWSQLWRGKVWELLPLKVTQEKPTSGNEEVAIFLKSLNLDYASFFKNAKYEFQFIKNQHTSLGSQYAGSVLIQGVISEQYEDCAWDHLVDIRIAPASIAIEQPNTINWKEKPLSISKKESREHFSTLTLKTYMVGTQVKETKLLAELLTHDESRVRDFAKTKCSSKSLTRN
jgi:hypothetical protein